MMRNGRNTRRGQRPMATDKTSLDSSADSNGSLTNGSSPNGSASNGSSNGSAGHSELPDGGPRAAEQRRVPASRFRPVLITGGAGFIGTNLASRLLRQGRRVLIYDNLSRPGVERNLQWLISEFGSAVDVLVADIRDAHTLHRAVACAERVYHFAAQVAVTTSLQDPYTDFTVNAEGTVNLLEAIRRQVSPPPLLFTSTNKVYGDLNEIELCCDDDRYAPTDRKTSRYGVNEQQNLSFHSPYGCSKGVADQYVLDYARCYRLPAVVFRMSCIYGPHQCGNEDQGWVAHFLLRALADEPITLFGDGKQVRDVLFVKDLVDALCVALDRIDQTRGCAFNVGGGPANTISLLELIELITEIHGTRPVVRHAPWRQGDQRYFVSDIRALQAATGWTPRVDVAEGVQRLYEWLREHRLAPVERATVLEEKTPTGVTGG